MQQLIPAVATSRQGLASGLFAQFPGLGTTSYAPDPVWKESARGEVRFFRIAKRDAWATYRKLKMWNRQKVPGRYGGAIGSACLRVYESLVFDFLNFRNGRLDPSYEAIAAKTGLSRSTVAEALKRLKALRVIFWQRRCSMHHDDRRGVRFEQETNAYGVLPPAQWLGYVEPPSPPVLAPAEWGAAPPLPDILTQASAAARSGGTAALVQVLEADPGKDTLAAALAALGRRILAAKS